MSLLFFLKPLWITGAKYVIAARPKKKKVYKVVYEPEAKAKPLDLSALRTEIRRKRQQKEEHDFVGLLLALEI